MHKWSIFIALIMGCGNPDTDTDKDTDTDVEDPKFEADCADGDDNDEDGDIDCADTDCAEAFECTWPDTLDHETLMTFTGRTIECKIAGVGFPYNVDDCITQFTAALTYAPDDTDCTECDRVYKGPLTWLNDSCSELLGENGPKPEATEYGLSFTSETQRTLYVNDPNTGWTEAVMLSLEGNEWVNVTEVPVKEDIDQCNNGEQYLGDLNVRVSFRDL